MKLEHRENEHKASGTTLQVKEDQTLEALLTHHMQGRSKSSLKKLLQSEMISVEGEIIKKQSLYDLRARPSLYLLDAQKKVLLKDVLPEKIFAYLAQKLS